MRRARELGVEHDSAEPSEVDGFVDEVSWHIDYCEAWVAEELRDLADPEVDIPTGSIELRTHRRLGDLRRVRRTAIAAALESATADAESARLRGDGAALGAAEAALGEVRELARQVALQRLEGARRHLLRTADHLQRLDLMHTEPGQPQSLRDNMVVLRAEIEKALDDSAATFHGDYSLRGPAVLYAIRQVMLDAAIEYHRGWADLARPMAEGSEGDLPQPDAEWSLDRLVLRSSLDEVESLEQEAVAVAALRRGVALGDLRGIAADLTLDDSGTLSELMSRLADWRAIRPLRGEADDSPDEGTPPDWTARTEQYQRGLRDEVGRRAARAERDYHLAEAAELARLGRDIGQAMDKFRSAWLDAFAAAESRKAAAEEALRRIAGETGAKDGGQQDSPALARVIQQHLTGEADRLGSGLADRLMGDRIAKYRIDTAHAHFEYLAAEQEMLRLRAEVILAGGDFGTLAEMPGIEPGSVTDEVAGAVSEFTTTRMNDALRTVLDIGVEIRIGEVAESAGRDRIIDPLVKILGKLNFAVDKAEQFCADPARDPLVSIARRHKVYETYQRACGAGIDYLLALADSRVNDNRIGPRPGESLRDQAMASARDIRAGAADSVAGYRRTLAETHLTGSVETGAHWLSCYSLRAQADAAYLRGDAEAVRAAQSELVELLSRPGAAQPPQSGWLELALDDRVKPEEPYLWQAWAARQYELIRARMRANPGDRTDIDAIVGTLTQAGAVRYDGTSYTHEQISSILTHIFLSQHLLRDDAGELYDDHLDPDFQLLEALYELIAGRWSPHTGVLLEHELFEIEFDPRTDPLARPVTPWRDIHVRAEQRLPDNGSNWIAGLSVQQRDDRELGLATFGPIRSGADNSGPAGAIPKPDGAVSGPPAHEAETAETPLTHLQERVLRALVGRPKRSKKVAELVGVSGNAALKTLKSLERRNLVAGRADGKWTTTPGLAAPSPGVRAADPAGPDTRGTEVAAHDWPGDYLNALLHAKGWSGKDLADSIDDSDISESLVAAVLQRSSSITIRQWRKILLALGVPESDRNLFARRFIDGLDSFSTKPGAHESLSSYLLACRLDREISQNELARLTGLPVWSIRVAQTTREWSPKQFGFWFDPLVEELVRPEDRAEVVSRFGPEQTDPSDTGLPADSAAAEETSARARTADVDWTPETADLGPGDIGLLAEVISEKPSDPSLWYAWAEEQYRLIRLWIGGGPEGEIREIVQNLENVKRKEGQPPFTVSDIKQVLSYIFVDQHWFRTADGSDYFAHFDSDFQIAEAIYRMVRGDWSSGEVDPAVLKASDIRLVEHEIGEIAFAELDPDESWKEQHNRANSRLKNGHSDWEYGLETVTGLVPMRGEREDYVRRFGPIHSGAGRSGERPENDSAILPGSAHDHGADSARDNPEDSSGGQGESPIDVGDLVRAAHEGDELAGARLRTYFIPEIYRTLERKNPEGDPWLTYVLTVDTLHNALDTVLARDLGADPESDFEAARAEAIRTTPAAATLKARLLRDSGSVLAGREDLRARIESAPPHVVARAVDRLTSRHGDGPTVRQFEELLQHIRSFGPTRRSLHNDRLSYSDLGTLIDDLIRAGGFTSQTQVDQVAGFRVNATHSLVTKSRGPIDVIAGIFELVSLPRPLWNPIAWQLAGGLPDSFSTAAAAHNTFHSYIAVRRWAARSPSDDSRPMSPQELADILGVTATVIRRLELGSSRHAGAPEFRRSLYRALDIPEAEWEVADRLFESGPSVVPEKGRTGGETASENTVPPYTDMQNRIVAVLAEREECSLSDLSYLTRGAYQRVRNAIRRLQTLGIVEPVADTAPARYRLLPDAPNKPPVVAGGRALSTDGPLTYRQVRVAQLLADRPMNVPELESALGMPKYSVRWDLEKLIDEGFVEVASRRKPAVYRSARELPPEMRPVPDGPRDLGEDGDSGPDDRGGTAGVVDANCVARSAAATNAWYSRNGVAEPVIHSHVTTDGGLVTADDSLPTPLFHDPGDEGVPVQAMSWMAQGHNIFQGSGRDGLWAVADVLSEPIDNDPTPDGRLGHGRGMWITLTPRHTPTGEPTAHAAFVVNEHGSLRLIDPTSGPGFDPATYEPEDFDPATYEPEEFGPPLFDPVHDLVHGIGIKPDGHPLHPLFDADGDATDLFENTPRPESPEEHRAYRPGPYVQGARPGPGLDPEAVRALNRYFHPRVYQHILGRVEALPDHLSDTDPSDSDLWTAHTLTTAVLRRAETALRKAHPGADARELTDTDLADEYQRILRGAASVTFSEHVTKLDLLHNLAPVLADRPEWHHLVSAPPHAVVRAVTSLAKRGESVTADQVAIDRLMHLLPDPEGIAEEGLRPGLAHYPDIASLLPGLRWAAGFTNGHQLDIAADLSKDTNRKVDQRKGKSTPENWKKIFEVLQLPPKLAEEIVRRFLPDQLSDFRLIVSGVDVSTRGRILDCLARGTFTASQLEELLGLSRSTVHRTLVDLRSSGAVQVTDDTAWPKTYSLAQDRPDNMADALPIGGFLAGSRRARGMSQADLATETGMSQQTISDAELNKLSPVRVAQYLVTVAAPLRIPAEDVTAAALTFLGGTFDSPATRADDHTTVLSLVNACRIDARNNTVDRVESFGIAARKDRIQELLWHGPELAVVKRAVHLGNRDVLDQQLRRFERVMRRGGVVGEDAWRSIVAAAHSVISQTPDDSTRMRSWLSAVAASVLRDHATMPPPGPDEWLEATHGCLSDPQQGIVRLLSGQRHSASALRESLGLEPWPVDDALKQLRDMGIVKKVGGGYETTYRLVEPYEDSAEFNPPPLGHSPGVSLKRFRVAKEWSQSQLAEAAGCSERTVQHAESRTESSLRTKDSSFYTYSRLLAALDAPDSYRDLFCEFLDGLDSFRTDPAAHDSIGSWLLAWRIAKVVAGAWGLTPRALSALSGVSEKVIRKTENNTVPQETVQECLVALAGPLEISKEDLNAAALRFMDGQLDSYDTDVGSHTGFVSLVNACRVGAGQAARGRVANLRIAAMQPQAIDLLWEGPTVELVKTAVMSGNTGVIERMLKRFEPALRRGRPVSDEMWANIAESARLGIRDARRGIRMRHWLDGLVRAELPGDYEPAESPDPLEWAEAIAGWLSGTQIRIIELLAAQPLRTQELQELPELAGVEAEPPLLELRDMGIVRVERHGKQIVNHVVEPSAAAPGSRNSVTGADGASHSPVPMVESARRVVTVALPEDSGGGSDLPRDGSVQDAAGSAGKASRSHSIEDSRAAGTILSAMKETGIDVWAIRILERYGVVVEFSSGPDARVVYAEGRRIEQGAAIGYDPVRNAVTLDAGGDPGKHRHILIVAARMAEQLAGRSTPDPSSVDPAESVDRTRDLLADAYALAYRAALITEVDGRRLGGPRFRTVEASADPRDPLSRAYTEAYEQAFDIAWRSYDQVSHHRPMYHAAAHRAGMRAVRLSLDTLGPRVDGRDLSAHIAALRAGDNGSPTAESETPELRADSLIAGVQGSLAWRAERLAEMVAGLRAKRARGVFVVESTVEEIYSDAYAEAERALQQNPDATAPEIHAYREVLDFLREESSELTESELAVVLLDVADAVDQLDDPAWGGPRAQTVVATPGSEGPAAVRGADDHRIWRAVWDRFQELGNELGPDVRPGRTGGGPVVLSDNVLVEYHRPDSLPYLRVVARPGEHMNVLRQLSLSSSDYAGVLWDRSRDIGYWEATVGPRNELNLRSLSAAEAEGPNREPTGFAAVDRLVDHYLRLRREQRTELGLGEWLHQLGPQAFHTEEERPIPVGTLRGEFVETGFTRAREEQTLRGEVFDDTHPVSVAYDLHTRKVHIPVDPAGTHRPEHHRLEVFAVGPTHLSIHLEPDSAGGWRVPAPVGAGSPADIADADNAVVEAYENRTGREYQGEAIGNTSDTLADHFRGLTASTPEELTARIAAFLEDPGAGPLTGSVQPATDPDTGPRAVDGPDDSADSRTPDDDSTRDDREPAVPGVERSSTSDGAQEDTEDQSADPAGETPEFEVVTTEVAHAAPSFRMMKYKVRMPDGNVHPRDVLDVPATVAVLPVDRQGRVVLSRRFRTAVDDVVLELPSGVVVTADGALPVIARRILAEYGLATGADLSLVTDAVRSGGSSNAVTRVLVAREVDDIKGVEPPPDMLRVPLTEAISHLTGAALVDTATAVGVLAAVGEISGDIRLRPATDPPLNAPHAASGTPPVDSTRVFGAQPLRRGAEDTVWSSPFNEVRRLELHTPDGGVLTEDIITRHPTVLALPWDERTDEVVLVRQYRAPLGRWIYQLPAGMLDKAGEDPLTGARRELAEEAGLAALDWSELLTAEPLPGITDEHHRIYLARNLYGIPRLDAGESDEIGMGQVRVPVDEALAMALRGEIDDGPAVVSLLALASVRAGRLAPRVVVEAGRRSATDERPEQDIHGNSPSGNVRSAPPSAVPDTHVGAVEQYPQAQSVPGSHPEGSTRPGRLPADPPAPPGDRGGGSSADRPRRTDRPMNDSGSRRIVTVTLPEEPGGGSDLPPDGADPADIDPDLLRRAYVRGDRRERDFEIDAGELHRTLGPRIHQEMVAELALLRERNWRHEPVENHLWVAHGVTMAALARARQLWDESPGIPEDDEGLVRRYREILGQAKAEAFVGHVIIRPQLWAHTREHPDLHKVIARASAPVLARVVTALGRIEQGGREKYFRALTRPSDAATVIKAELAGNNAEVFGDAAIDFLTTALSGRDATPRSRFARSLDAYPNTSAGLTLLLTHLYTAAGWTGGDRFAEAAGVPPATAAELMDGTQESIAPEIWKKLFDALLVPDHLCDRIFDKFRLGDPGAAGRPEGRRGRSPRSRGRHEDRPTPAPERLRDPVLRDGASAAPDSQCTVPVDHGALPGGDVESGMALLKAAVRRDTIYFTDRFDRQLQQFDAALRTRVALHRESPDEHVIESLRSEIRARALDAPDGIPVEEWLFAIIDLRLAGDLRMWLKFYLETNEVRHWKLAADAHVDVGTITSVVHGVHRPLPDTWWKVLKGLGVPSWYRDLVAKEFLPGIDSFSTSPAEHRTFNSLMTARRITKGLSQVELARIVAVHPATVRKVEDGSLGRERFDGSTFKLVVGLDIYGEDSGRAAQAFFPGRLDSFVIDPRAHSRIGSVVTACRHRLGLSGREFGKRFGVSAGTVARIEADERVPTAAFLRRMYTDTTLGFTDFQRVQADALLTDGAAVALVRNATRIGNTEILSQQLRRFERDLRRRFAGAAIDVDQGWAAVQFTAHTRILEDSDEIRMRQWLEGIADSVLSGEIDTGYGLVTPAEIDRRDEWARTLYDVVRAELARDERGVAEAIRRTLFRAERDWGKVGFDVESELVPMLRYIFVDTHDLIDENTGEIIRRRFDADFQIMEAILRLITGERVSDEVRASDIRLVEHELLERSLSMQGNHKSRHDDANVRFDWVGGLPAAAAAHRHETDEARGHRLLSGAGSAHDDITDPSRIDPAGDPGEGDDPGRGGLPVDDGELPDDASGRSTRLPHLGKCITVTLPDGESEQQDASGGFVPDASGTVAGASHSHSIEYGTYNGRPAVSKRLAVPVASESAVHTVLRLLPEAAVLEAVRDVVPVARPLESSGTRLVTERLDGGPATGVDIERPEFARAVVSALARLYRYEPGEELRGEQANALRADGFSVDDAPLRLMRDFLVRVAGDVHRIFPETARGIGLLTPEELAARLGPVPPKRRRSRLIHGDLYAPNIIVAGEQVRLIDWELARIGDPLADIAQYLRYLRLSGVEGYEDHRAEFLRICDELLGDDIIGGWQQDLPWVEQVYSLISTYRQLWYFARLDTPTEQAATYFHDRLRGEERFLAGTAPDAETIMALREQARREWEESPDGVLEKMDDLAQQGNADKPWTAVQQRTFLDQITATREAVARAGRAGRIESDRAGRLWREIDELALDAEQHLSAPAPSETLRGALRRSGDDGLRAISRRILLVGQFWDPHMGGVPVFNRQLAHGFAEAGHEVYVQVEDDIDGVDPGPGITLLSRACDDFGAVPDVDIDLIITHSRFTGHVGRMIRALRCPDATLAHIVHSISPASHGVQGEAEAGLANERVEKAMISTADVVFGVGPVLAEYIGDLAAATHVTPALQETLPGLKFSEPLPVPEFGRTTSLYVAGRFDEPRKGFAEAADMVRQLGERGLDVSLTVRGCAPVGISRAEKLLSQRAGRKVTVLPYTTGEAELRADLANTHLVLMPSRAESFGMAGTEALAAGVPVVMPDSSGVGRFLGDARRFDPELVSGLLVAQTFTEPLPMQEWVDTVERALRDLPGAWARARQIRQELQAGGYTWRSAANRMVEAACPPSAGPARAVAGYRDADPEPPRDGAGARERAVAELRSVADRAAIPAVDHDTRTIFEERIVPELLTGPNLRPVERPKLFVFVGQAGAGKSTAIREIFDDVNQNGDGAVTLQFDEFLRYHPHFEEIRRQDEFSAHDKLKPITKEFQSMAIGYALDNRYNAVFESGPSDAVKTLEIVRSFQARGYEVELHSFAIALPESRLSAAHRFMQQHVRAGTGRWMPLEHQTAAYDGVLEFTRLAESPPPVVDSLSVRNRIDVLFENRRLPDGNWLEAPQATDILAYERTRPPTREEAHAYREKLRAFRDSITGHRDPAVREMLLCEADLIAEAARPWLGQAT
ncbi:zeta toxin family protein [Nocardia carnea]|uniref:zeta toxin family protein n=1 Tax=Nocardia carnea TaxID=37328 RepID=UPI002456A920|nr:zeta toxin family protein [Nocardia carnea]